MDVINLITNQTIQNQLFDHFVNHTQYFMKNLKSDDSNDYLLQFSSMIDFGYSLKQSDLRQQYQIVLFNSLASLKEPALAHQVASILIDPIISNLDSPFSDNINPLSKIIIQILKMKQS